MPPVRAAPIIAGMAVVLISFLHSWPDAVEAQCSICGENVYEQQANLDRVRAEDGFVVCIACALVWKLEFPALFPAVDAQLWQCHVREPQPTPETEPLLDFLNKNLRR